eukprot:COSAG01_NODE_7755_length_3068_cov_11.491748_1_plen_112_part_10
MHVGGFAPTPSPHARLRSTHHAGWQRAEVSSAAHVNPPAHVKSQQPHTRASQRHAAVRGCSHTQAAESTRQHGGGGGGGGGGPQLFPPLGPWLALELGPPWPRNGRIPAPGS